MKRIDHVAIAVANLEQALPFWADALGLDVTGMETVESERVRVAFLPIGESAIELLEATGDDSPVAKFVRERGGGIHHLTLAVDDLDAALARLDGAGCQILGGGARPGAGGSRVAFVHPRSAGGVLLELVERQGRREPAPELVPGSVILLYLRDPQEKQWGVLRRLDTAGVMFEGIDLGSFDDWVAQIERDEESIVGPSLTFVPMLRVEKLLLDRSSGRLPSLAERFERRVGRSVQQVLAEGSG